MTSTTFFIIFIPILAILLLAINLILAPHNPYQEKDSVFECGFHSFLGQNRTQFSVSFFIFGLLFLLFDLEILLVYPYSVSTYTNDIYGLVVMMVFFVLLTLGFVFELGKNALTIDSRQTSYNNVNLSTPHAHVSSVSRVDIFFFGLVLFYGKIFFNMMKGSSGVSVYHTIVFLFLSICVIILYSYLCCSYRNRKFKLSYFSKFIICIKAMIMLFLILTIALEFHFVFIDCLINMIEAWVLGTTTLTLGEVHLTSSMNNPSGDNPSDDNYFGGTADYSTNSFTWHLPLDLDKLRTQGKPYLGDWLVKWRTGFMNNRPKSNINCQVSNISFSTIAEKNEVKDMIRTTSAYTNSWGPVSATRINETLIDELLGL